MIRLPPPIFAVALSLWFAVAPPLTGEASAQMPAQTLRTQERVASECLAIAQQLPSVTFASYAAAPATRGSVTITYVGHSTYQIETPGDVVIATDYNGVYRARRTTRSAPIPASSMFCTAGATTARPPATCSVSATS